MTPAEIAALETAVREAPGLDEKGDNNARQRN